MLMLLCFEAVIWSHWQAQQTDKALGARTQTRAAREPTLILLLPLFVLNPQLLFLWEIIDKACFMEKDHKKIPSSHSSIEKPNYFTILKLNLR